MCANVNLKIALNIYRTWDYQLTYSKGTVQRGQCMGHMCTSFHRY